MAKRNIDLEREVSYSPAAWKDVMFFYRLRNQPETYKYFRYNRNVRFLRHLRWFMKLLLPTSDKKLYVITYGGIKVGQIRFDKLGKDGADISISILKEYMGKGIMGSALEMATKEYLARNKEIRKLYAFIHPENKNSIHFFKKFEFKKDGEIEGIRSRELRYARPRNI